MYDRERERSGELLRQRAALGQFGELALKSDDLDEILTEACRLVSEALGTDLAKVLQACEGEAELFVRAGIGWRPGVVGNVKVPTGTFSAAGHALFTGEAVISNDVEQESRFEVPEFMRDHGVVAMVNAIVLGPDGMPPYGVLEVDSRVRRSFTQDDVDFLRTYANLLSSAVQRFQVTNRLRMQAEERERLMRELQHRVKNNLQVISSLVHLQISRTHSPEAERELTAIGHRIETLRIVHDQLHAVGGGDRVDLGDYLQVLASGLLEFHGEQAAGIELKTELQSMVVPAELAVPVGIIVTEFVTNSFKYAFEGAGTIGVRLEALSSKATRITLWDDGKGLPEGRTASTGMQLIAGFSRQIRAEPVWETDGGTRLTLTVKS